MAAAPVRDGGVAAPPRPRGKGPLGEVYPRPAYIMEGDTPSFLNLIPNGLSDPERPDWGGWGGRYDKLSSGLGLWTTTTDEVRGIDGKSYATPQATVWRWRSAMQNDFAARMAWSVTPRADAVNHALLDKGKSTARLINGRYIDRLEKRDGEWRIALRRTTVDVLVAGDASILKHPRFVEQGYTKGMRDRSDVSYQRPLSLDEPVERW